MNWTRYTWARIGGVEQLPDWSLIIRSPRAMAFLLGDLLNSNEAVLLKADNGWTARVYRTVTGVRYVKVFRPDGSMRGLRRFR